jgi:hypothetical protein
MSAVNETACPFCKEVARFDTVDIGVGEIQCGPAECTNRACRAAQDMQGIWRDGQTWDEARSIGADEERDR